VRGLVAGDDARGSYALLDAPREGATLRRPGSSIAGARLLHVAWDRIWLARPSSPTTYAICQAELGADATSPPPPLDGTSSTSSAAAVDPADTEEPASARGIARRGPREFVIERSTRDALLDDEGGWMRTVRIVPAMEGGQVVGAQIVSVKRGSVLGRLGLQAGDRLESVNGYELTSPERTLEALARLRSAPTLRLRLLRGGSAVELEYTIQ
jgi:general secretion pathway protein C